jgi:pSer/pThr/pTyr-binding forkhead associated (FHA) protein
MNKLVMSLGGEVVREVVLSQDKTTLGRRPYNDIVVDNLAISGEHAVFQVQGGEVFIEDLKSTNGTCVNGAAIKRHRLQHDDVIEIGKYKIRFLSEALTQGRAQGLPQAQAPAGADVVAARVGPVTAPASGLGLSSAPGALQALASVRVLNGAAAGRELVLTKDRTTLGKSGVQVVAIDKRGGGYLLIHVEGAQRPSVNGIAVPDDGVWLSHGDVIELSGTRMQFTNA